MKKSVVFLCFVVLVFGLIGSVSAMTYTDTYDAQHRYMKGSVFGPKERVSWTFDLTKDGFDPDTQDVTAARMQLSLEDDNDFFSIEIARLDVGDNVFWREVDTGTSIFRVRSLLSLSTTGMLQATLIAFKGDFYFNSATLTAKAIDAIPTPEPATVMLFGMGLAGLAAVGAARRKKMKKSVR